MSHVALGRRLRNTNPSSLRHAAGLSVYETEEQARANARKFPRLGRYIAKLEIPAGAPITVEETGVEESGLHTIFGEPADVLTCVLRPLTPV